MSILYVKFRIQRRTDTPLAGKHTGFGTKAAFGRAEARARSKSDLLEDACAKVSMWRVTTPSAPWPDCSLSHRWGRGKSKPDESRKRAYLTLLECL